MTHIHRNKVSYRGEMKEVIGQGSNKYQIKYKRKLITIMIDPFSGSVALC